MFTRIGGTGMDSMLNEQGQSIEQEIIPFVVVPLIHEMKTNSTQLAEKRAVGPRKCLLLYVQIFY